MKNYKKTVSLFIATAILFSLSACGKTDETTSENIETSETTLITEVATEISSETTTVASETNTVISETSLAETTISEVTSSLPIPYVSILQEVKAALANIDDSANWSDEYFDVCYAASTMYYAYGTNPLDTIGYTVTDVDNNGVPELIIGYIGNSGERTLIIKMYTYDSEDAPAVNLISNGGDRNAYYLLDNGHIINLASSSAFNSYISSYQISPDGNSIQFIDSYFTDLDQDNNSQLGLYYTTDESALYSRSDTNSTIIGAVLDGNIDSLIPSNADYFGVYEHIDLTPLSSLPV